MWKNANGRVGHLTAGLTESESPMSSPTFSSLGVPARLIAALTEQGITEPFPIQQATLPDSLAGRDLLGRGRTGSGKTLAFAIPTVAALAASPTRRQSNRPRALVLVPTRELAKQVADVFIPLAGAANLKVTTVFGGVGQGPQVTALRHGVDIVVACPGRLEDLIQQRHCKLDAVEITVLDEADHMADLGFLPAVRRLLDATPTKGQRLLFSATLDRDIDNIVQRYLHDHVVHSVDPAISQVSTMTHHVFSVSAADKPEVVRQLSAGQHRTLLFMRTKHGAKRLAQQLTRAGTPSVELHGNLSQNARERNLAEFAAGRSRVLVATDVAARGLHVDDIALVVHVDPPAEHKAFLHRSGRTARAGSDGVVVTIATPDQTKAVRDLARAAKITPTVTSVRPGSDAIRDLVGEPAALVAPRPVAVAATPAKSHGAPRRSTGTPSRSPRPAGTPGTSRPQSGRRRSGTARTR
jgi:superfamily II DNA/RNA helicase